METVMQNVADYLKFLGAAKRRHRSTVQRHRLWLMRWIAYCQQHDADPDNPPRDVVLDWTVKVASERAASTHSHAVSVLRQYFDWLCWEGRAMWNPFQVIEGSPSHPPLPRPLEVSQVEAMLNSFDFQTPYDWRDAAVIWFMWSTACRPIEVIDLELKHLRLEEGYTYIYSRKTRDERIAPLLPECVRVMRTYLTLVRPHLTRGKQLKRVFLGQPGSTQMDSQTLRDIFHRAGIRAGLSVRPVPKQMRATVATALLENGADIRYVQAFLGHSRISSTQHYTRVLRQKVEETYRKHHPFYAQARSESVLA